MVGTLDGIKVLDLARVIAGPHCGMILGDLGAEVIKVEKPGTGDMSRGYLPKVKGESTYFLTHNRNKKSITLDFRHPKAKEILFGLVKKADVLVENFRAGTLEEMGYSYDELKKVNPRLILTRVSGFGQDGPYAQRTCFDGAAQAMSGIMDVTGMEDGPPVMVGTYVVDYTAALYATIGTLAALRTREITGEGQIVDVSLLDSAVSLLHTAITDYCMLGKKMTRHGNNDRYAWPGNVYIAKDNRYVYIHAGMDSTFSSLVKIMNREDLLKDDRYNNRMGRMQHIKECDNQIQEWVSTKSVDEIIKVVAVAGIPCAMVNDVAKMTEDPQIRHRNMIAEIEHPTVGKVYMTGPVIHFSETPEKIRYAPPLLGQHNKEVYGEWLGFSDEEISQMAFDKCI